MTNRIVLERCLAIHLAHRNGPSRKAARAMARLTIAALRLAGSPISQPRKDAT